MDVGTDRIVAVVFQNGLARDLNQLIPPFDWNLVTGREPSITAAKSSGSVFGPDYPASGRFC